MTREAEKSLLTDFADGILTVTLNRPAVFNALNVPTLHELLRIFQNEATEPGVRCVILTGAGKAFCAGQDLEERRAFVEGSAPPPSLGESLRRRYNLLVTAMRNLAAPVIGAVNGVAAGAGCSLALACDLRAASENASFIQSFVKVGLGLDSGSSYTLPRLVGSARALELALLGDKLDAPTALAWGIVNRVVPGEQLMEEARNMAKKIAAGPPQTTARIKRELYFAQTADFPAALENEATEQETAASSSEYREGLTAFFAKRPPKF